MLDELGNLEESILADLRFSAHRTAVLMRFNQVRTGEGVLRPDLETDAPLWLRLAGIETVDLRNRLTESNLDEPTSMNWGMDEFAYVGAEQTAALWDRPTWSVRVEWEGARDGSGSSIVLVCHSIRLELGENVHWRQRSGTSAAQIKSAMSQWFRVRNTEAPWGDYGRILVDGIASRRDDGALLIERTGPFVPPITIMFGQDIVVTDAFKHELESSGLRLHGFRQVVKKRIVRLDWRRWDLGAREPERPPPSGEPENFILMRKHNKEMSHAMGMLWELRLDVEVDGGSDLVRPRPGLILASLRARDWLADRAGNWLRFVPADASVEGANR